MDNLNDFYSTRREREGAVFAILQYGKLDLVEVVQVGIQPRGSCRGRIYKAVSLLSARAFHHEIEVHEDAFYQNEIPKRIPGNRIIRAKAEVFHADDFRWLLHGLPEEADIYYLGDFYWTFGYSTRQLEREIEMRKSIKEIARLQSKLKRLVEPDEEEDDG